MKILKKMTNSKIIYVLCVLFVFTCNKKSPTASSLLDDATLIPSVTKSYKMINNLIFPEDTIKALVLGNTNVPLANIRIEFDLVADVPGQLASDHQFTNVLGEAWTLYSLNEQDIENLSFTNDTSLTIVVGIAAGEDENSMILNNTLQWDIELSYEGDPYQVQWFNFKDPMQETLINNISQIDTITVTARNQDGVAVCNVPIHFSLRPAFDASNQPVPEGSIPPFGVLTSGVAFTCLDGDPEFGEAEIRYQNLNAGTDQLFAKIVNDEDETEILFLDSLYILNIDSSTYYSPINSVNSFHYYPNNENIINLASEDIDISVIALNQDGANICDIPVFFQLRGTNGQDANGFIDKNIAITCDSVNDSTNNSGLATVTYQNINGGIDSLFATLIDTSNQSSILADILIIETVGSTLLIDDVESINCNISSSHMVFTSPDSMKTDTIFSRALDNNNSLIPGIPFEYSIMNAIGNSAYLSAGGAISDSSGIAYTILNVHQSIFSNTIDSLSINVGISIPTTLLHDSVNVTCINQVPLWYEFSAELNLTSDAYILPYTNTGEDPVTVTAAQITATLLDSLLNPPPAGMVIEFSSLQEDTTSAGEETWEQIGNITPGAVFDENGLATAQFIMGDDRGIAHIIGTVNDLSDTIKIVLESTNASHIQILPPVVDEIMVQGGGGTESSLVEVIIVDDFQNTVLDEQYQVHFEITGAPVGVTLDESGLQEVIKLSNFGSSNVTIVSGSAPGSVQLSVGLYNIDDDISTDTPIAVAENIPLTIVTGPPEYGQLNFSFLGIVADEVGAVYHVPLSVYLEDLHSNPVSDSTSVYFKIREVAETYDTEATYGYEDKVTWLSSIAESITALDSIVYECINQLAGCLPAGPLQEDFDLSNHADWEAAAYPAFIIGEGETGMVNSSGDSYSGIAYSEITYGSASIASEIIIFAQTYSTDNSLLIIDSRDTHNDDGVILPCYDCQITIFALPTQWNFSLPPFDPDCPEGGGVGCFADFQDVTVQATVTDHFQYYVNNALISLEAPQADFTFVCNGEDTDLDGITGFCVNVTDATDILALVDSCWECADYNPEYIWIIEDTDENDIDNDYGILSEFNCANNTPPSSPPIGIENCWYDLGDGTGFCGNCYTNNEVITPDDIPNYARTNASGVGLYTIRYNEGVNIPIAGEGTTTYETFLPTLTLTLLTPSTNGPTATTTLTITKSEED